MLSLELQEHSPIRRWSRAEYERIGTTGIFADERVELLEGVIFAMSPQGDEHQWSIVTATRYLVRTLGDRADVRVQLPFGATDDSEPGPDFALTVPERSVTGTPTTALLVIEISDSTVRKDREVKAPVYARARVPEYWLVDVNRGVVEVRTLPDGGVYTRLETWERSARVRLVAFPDVELDLAQFLPPPV